MRTIMISRSLLACLVLSGAMASGSASAQMLLCPEPSSVSVETEDMTAEARQLLTRLTVALDLHGHRGIDEDAIMQANAETPSALIAKLDHVANRCVRESRDLEAFYEALPALRKSFLEAVGLAEEADAAVRDSRIKNASENLTKAERVESAIDLSVRELWRKLWFRPAKGGDHADDRFAVIVASPTDADSGWDKLGEHQRRWKDAYFQLHEPYYKSNPHHAIVVGRRLPREQAERLRDYAIELGMAEDAYVWPLPIDATSETLSDRAKAPEQKAEQDGSRERLDLSVLQ
jgi:hypothetical protein